MALTITNTTANREIEGNVEKILALIKPTSCRYFIDAFAGSGSFSLSAMEQGIAESYLINEAYPPIIYMFEAVRDNPERLILEYKNLCQLMFEKNQAVDIFQDNCQILAEELANANTAPLRQAVLWLFLANQLNQNRPLFSGEKIISRFDAHPSIGVNELIPRISRLNQIFQNKKLSLSASNAYDFILSIEKLNNNDFVILDPPYPGYWHPENSIFFRPENDEILFQKLLLILELLYNKKVKFIFNYDLFFGKEAPCSKGYLINPKKYGLRHYLLISNNPHDPEFTTLFEHIYISENIDIYMLPKGIYPFEMFRELNYRDANDALRAITESA